jgi:3',5'-cyclic AMP phosphodiesterase CpdA
MRIVQVTDTHLRATATTVHWGYRPVASLAAVLDAVAADEEEVDMLIVTGDCIHAFPLEEDETFREGQQGDSPYHLLRTLLEQRLPAARLRAIPGNHDSRAHLSAVFPESAGGGTGGPPPPQAHCFAEKLGGWLVIGCDSQSGDPADPASEGDLTEPQLAWMRSALEAHADSPAVIFLHHPPTHDTPESFTEAGTAALEELLEATQGQVVGVVAGHIHADFTASMLGGVPLFTSPSSVFQSRINAEGLLLGSPNDAKLGPGYRVLDLGTDGTLSTRVARPLMPARLAQFPELLQGPRMARRDWPQGATALL